MTTLNVTTLAQTTLTSVQLNQVIEQLKDMSDSSLQICHNNYCVEIGYEDIIYDNDEYNVNEQFETPFDVLRNIQSYNLSDDYFYFHNGNLISFNYLTGDDSPMTFSELAQWIVDNELFSDYDIDVTTLEDMLASIEDNITDDEDMLNKLIIYSNIELECYQFATSNGYPCYNDYSIGEAMIYLNGLEYNQLNDIIIHLNINYN